MTVLKMADLDLSGKRVLIREDLNVPVKNGKVTSDARIRASLPTIQLALDAGAKVIVMSHLGRPEEGVYDEESSIKPVAAHLAGLLGRDVNVIKDFREGVEVAAGEVVLLENVRFNKGEKKDADELAQAYAALCDVFVMDNEDQDLASEIEEMGLTPLVTSTIMETEEDKIALAKEILALAD